ncbi:MAG: hypothetical protein KF819_10755 [Labilithrix sp.]|nr:hypothetical protein [Labilithrix sp.]
MRELLRTAAKSFDVICAGEARWNVARSEARSMRLRPGGGAVSAALALARRELRVGLATTLSDDRPGRALLERMKASAVDTGGVAFGEPESGLVFLERIGGARQVVSYREREEPIAIPEGWSSRVLLLSGLSPVVAHAGALCKAARAARRAGTIVVLDVNARWHLWAGRDARTIRMVLREADVVFCAVEDLFGLNMDAASMSAALRPNAILAMSDGARAWATGPFGEVVQRSDESLLGSGDAFAIAICAELARAESAPSGVALWERALQRGREAARARLTAFD